MTCVPLLDLRCPVLVDCDPGIDDAFALVALSGLHRAERIRLLGVSVTGGNVDVSSAARNAALVLAQCEIQEEVPLIVGSDPPLRPRSSGFHGVDGLGGRYFSSRFARSPIGDTDADVFRRVDNTTGIALLCIGPLTNIGRWLQHESFTRLQPHIVIMGGTMTAGHGNAANPDAEFNFYCDPAAAARVMPGNNPRTLVPLETTQQVSFTAHDLLDIRAECEWLGEMIDWSLTAHASMLSRPPTTGEIWLHDLVAVVALVHPELFTFTRANVTVGLDAENRGATTVTLDPEGSVLIATDADVDAVRMTCVRLVRDAVRRVPRLAARASPGGS
jgi:inosine-uridine nucleoside N-ribohydrolase